MIFALELNCLRLWEAVTLGTIMSITLLICMKLVCRFLRTNNFLTTDKLPMVSTK